MTAILVTGVSGVGKSTVLDRLGQLGYRVVDTDTGGWTENRPLPDGSGAEPLWREDRIDALLTDHEHSGEPLFLAGTVMNQGRFSSEVEPLLRSSATVEIDTRAAVAEVVEKLARLAGAPSQHNSR